MRVGLAHAAPPKRGVGAVRQIPHRTLMLASLRGDTPQVGAPAEQTWSHNKEGELGDRPSWRWLFLAQMCRFHHSSLLVPVDRLLSHRPWQGADGNKSCSSCPASMDGASCTRHEIGLADRICQAQLFRGSQQENGRGMSSSVPAELIEQKKQCLPLHYFILSVKLTCLDSLNKEDQA